MTVGRFMLLTAETGIKEAAQSMEEAAQEMEQQLGVLQKYINELPEKILSLGVRAVLALVMFVMIL